MKRTTKEDTQTVEFIAFYNATKDRSAQTLATLERWLDEGDQVSVYFSLEEDCYQSATIIQVDLSERIFYTCSGSVYEMLETE